MRGDERDREEDAQGRADEVDPEVADACGPRRVNPRIERYHHREAGRRRREVLHREAGHLREMAHRRLAAVALPVRVGDEAGRSVPREVGVHRDMWSGLNGRCDWRRWNP